MLFVMDNSTNEENLAQPLQINKKHFKNLLPLEVVMLVFLTIQTKTK